MQPKTILVVDDEFFNAEVLAFMLENEGYRVLCASNGRDGLQTLRQVPVDLVVVDLMMPIMDGAEMAQAMRADGNLTSIPILMTSALSEAAARSIFDGFDSFLQKPFLIKDALDRLTALLRAKGDD